MIVPTTDTGIVVVSVPFVAVPVIVKNTVVGVLDGLEILTVNCPFGEPSDAFGKLAVTVAIAVSLSKILILAGVVFPDIPALLVVASNVIVTFSVPSTIKSSITLIGNVTLDVLAGITIVVVMFV